MVIELSKYGRANNASALINQVASKRMESPFVLLPSPLSGRRVGMRVVEPEKSSFHLRLRRLQISNSLFYILNYPHPNPLPHAGEGAMKA
jgi:hypothetical protein